MQHEAMITTLKTIKMYGMAKAVADLVGQGSPAYQSAQEMLGILLKAEMAEREVRSIAYQMKASRFPVYRDLSSFDFSQSVVNEALIRQLHRCEFMDQAHNIVLVGGPGTGKTHLATALGVPTPASSALAASAIAALTASSSVTPSRKLKST